MLALCRGEAVSAMCCQPFTAALIRWAAFILLMRVHWWEVRLKVATFSFYWVWLVDKCYTVHFPCSVTYCLPFALVAWMTPSKWWLLLIFSGDNIKTKVSLIKKKVTPLLIYTFEIILFIFQRWNFTTTLFYALGLRHASMRCVCTPGTRFLQEKCHQ